MYLDCYFPKNIQVTSLQIHGFNGASEDAYAGVFYFRMVDTTGAVHTSMVMSKSKVSPIKRMSIPRLELCGALVLSRLLHHVKEVFKVPLPEVYAWTDSTIVLNWLVGKPRRFKTYVGNRISEIVDQIPPDRWNHVASADNLADCAFSWDSPFAITSTPALVVLVLLGYVWNQHSGPSAKVHPWNSQLMRRKGFVW